MKDNNLHYLFNHALSIKCFKDERDVKIYKNIKNLYDYFTISNNLNSLAKLDVIMKNYLTVGEEDEYYVPQCNFKEMPNEIESALYAKAKELGYIDKQIDKEFINEL